MDKIRPFRHPCPTEAELKSVANRPVLQKHQAILLLQGFRPDRGSANDYFYLEEYEDQIKKINAAETVGDIAFPIRVAEFVIWCNENDVALPEIFISEVTKPIIRLRRPKVAGPFTEEIVRWSDDDHNKGRARRGTKPTKETSIRGYESTIINLAREYVGQYIKKQGEFPEKWRVSRALAKVSKRPESKISRAFDLSALLTPNEVIKLKKQFRRKRQQDVKDGIYPKKNKLSPIFL